MVVYEACALLSLVAVAFLMFLGGLFISEYKYIQYDNGSYREAGLTCMWAAGIYLLILFLILFKLRKGKAPLGTIGDTGSNSSDEDSPFIKLTKKKTT